MVIECRLAAGRGEPGIVGLIFLIRIIYLWGVYKKLPADVTLLPLGNLRYSRYGVQDGRRNTRFLIFTAQRYARAVYAVIVCPSVCPSVCHKSEFYEDG